MLYDKSGNATDFDIYKYDGTLEDNLFSVSAGALKDLGNNTFFVSGSIRFGSPRIMNYVFEVNQQDQKVILKSEFHSEYLGDKIHSLSSVYFQNGYLVNAALVGKSDSVYFSVFKITAETGYDSYTVKQISE